MADLLPTVSVTFTLLRLVSYHWTSFLNAVSVTCCCLEACTAWAACKCYGVFDLSKPELVSCQCFAAVIISAALSRWWYSAC